MLCAKAATRSFRILRLLAARRVGRTSSTLTNSCPVAELQQNAYLPPRTPYSTCPPPLSEGSRNSYPFPVFVVARFSSFIDFDAYVMYLLES